MKEEGVLRCPYPRGKIHCHILERKIRSYLQHGHLFRWQLIVVVKRRVAVAICHPRASSHRFPIITPGVSIGVQSNPKPCGTRYIKRNSIPSAVADNVPVSRIVSLRIFKYIIRLFHFFDYWKFFWIKIWFNKKSTQTVPIFEKQLVISSRVHAANSDSVNCTFKKLLKKA